MSNSRVGLVLPFELRQCSLLSWVWNLPQPFQNTLYLVLGDIKVVPQIMFTVDFDLKNSTN